MKILNLAIILGLVMSLASCSSKKKKEETENMPEPSAMENNNEDFIMDDIAEEIPPAQEEETTMAPVEDKVAAIGPIGAYEVREGDTLMLVAFKIYGDYRRWREIANQNPGVNGTKLKTGMMLSYVEPETKFEWNPQGLPHLIKNGETLGTISHEKYGTPKRWKDLWENNKPMIIDPNLIFAGFTLHYIPDQEQVSKLTK